MENRTAVPAVLLLSFVVGGCGGLGANRDSLQEPTTRTYYIAADEVVWDYAPSGKNVITGEPFGELESHWVERGPTSIGHVYKKAIYREYTDSTFATLKPRPPEWEHLGILGPLLRAQVGDTIRIVYRNNVHFPTSLHPHGVFYDKDSEGTPYVDATDGRDKLDDAVPTGGTHVYVWPVPERAGPAEGDLSSVFWMYHSHTEEIKDVNAGLIGPMIVSARGTLTADGRQADVDREFVVAFAEMNENESWYIEDNVRAYAGDPDAVPIYRGPFGDVLVGAGIDWGKNFMESMNGFLYGHLPGLTMRVGERVRWYIMASTNFEPHTPHWHGNTVTIRQMRTDVAQLLPMGMTVAEMEPDNPGIWLFHCHLSYHLMAGMQSLYTVEPALVASGES